TAFNDGSGMATGTFTEGTCASGNTLGDAYGLQSRGTIFDVASVADAYGGYFDARNYGTGIEYGIYAKTTTVAGNWAGWFEGNVNISDTLVSGGGIVLGGVYRNSWPSGGTVDFDTINATRHDTVVVSEALKVVGELIADSIQAVGTVIDMDDDVNVIGAVSLGGDSTFRTDWEPQDVITVGGANADFTSLDDAIAAITAGTNTLIDIAPGDYVVTGAPTLGSSIHLRGSGTNTTRINGALTIEGYAFHLTFYGGTATFNDATASECNFEDDVAVAGASFGFCNFNGDPSVNSIGIADHAVFHDCMIEIPANVTGVCKVTGCAITNVFAVIGMGSMGEFTGNLFMGGMILVDGAEIYAEANLFKNDFEAGSVGPAINVLSGRAEIKANHFVDRAPGAIVVSDAIVTILSNDILWCGSEGEAAISAQSVSDPFEVNIIGNHIDGTDFPIAVPGIVLAGGTGCHGLIKDNVVERYNDGVVVSGMNMEMPDRMSIDNNVIYRNMNDGLRLGTGNYLVVHNDLYANNLSGAAGVDLNDGGANLVVSHNVVDTYSSLSSPVPGALNTMSIGNLWAGAPQVGQLP
ncbi:right-handed parallel beta-helix repeat-containing protein, partial [bacterium]|nr:right-handed parallel beta-helix repeat-containing protein [bacterium]